MHWHNLYISFWRKDVFGLRSLLGFWFLLPFHPELRTSCFVTMDISNRRLTKKKQTCSATNERNEAQRCKRESVSERKRAKQRNFNSQKTGKKSRLHLQAGKPQETARLFWTRTVHVDLPTCFWIFEANDGSDGNGLTFDFWVLGFHHFTTFNETHCDSHNSSEILNPIFSDTLVCQYLRNSEWKAVLSPSRVWQWHICFGNLVCLGFDETAWWVFLFPCNAHQLPMLRCIFVEPLLHSCRLQDKSSRNHCFSLQLVYSAGHSETPIINLGRVFVFQTKRPNNSARQSVPLSLSLSQRSKETSTAFKHLIGGSSPKLRNK